MSESCQYKDQCNGCSEWGKTFELQLEAKKKNLEESLIHSGLNLVHVEMVETARLRLRERVDISLINGRLGFFDKNQKSEIVDIDYCLLLTDELNGYLNQFREVIKKHLIFLDHKKISFRLRFGVNRICGVWIDTSHQNVKELLEEKNFLIDLLGLGIVEIGQKHKPLVKNADGVLKLQKELQLSPWIQTFDQNLNPMNLYSAISSFTQPGRISNRVLVKKLFSLIKDIEVKTVVEFFSGMGNFTLPILSTGAVVKSYEISLGAEESIKKSLEAYPEWRTRLQYKQFNLYSTSKTEFFNGEDLLIVDPPRSGLGFILDQITTTDSSRLPKHLIYISCFGDSFCQDMNVLEKKGYRTNQIIGVDQFPYSKHCEWMALFSL